MNRKKRQSEEEEINARFARGLGREILRGCKAINITHL
jgi:hypothetical protein